VPGGSDSDFDSDFDFDFDFDFDEHDLSVWGEASFAHNPRFPPSALGSRPFRHVFLRTVRPPQGYRVDDHGDWVP
jgi:hypothetical protein